MKRFFEGEERGNLAMALNFSPCAMYPVSPTEGDLASSYRVADWFAGDRIGNGFGLAEMEEPYGFFGWDRGGEGGGGSREPIANDILDLLPSDPFGMDLNATFTAIADWLEDFEVESGLNLIWNRAMVFGSPDNGRLGIGESSNSGWRFDGDLESVWDEDEILGFAEQDAIRVTSNFLSEENPSNFLPEERGGSAESVSDGDGGAPHDALLFSLGYLGVQDLLSAERACRSFREAVQQDALLWRTIHIDHPLNERITDHELLKLTGRAQGCLQSLSLVECSRVTDDGLRHVLESNPRLTKVGS